MTETSWPFHNGASGTPVYEDQWSIMARQWATTGVVGYPNDTSLQVYANASGREVHVRAGRASVRGHWLDVDAQVTLPVTANASGNPRIDLVVARLDPSDDSVALAVVAGTPGAIPTAPTPTQTDTGIWELELATVAVANGAATISGGNVTDRRTYSSQPTIPCLSTRRPGSPRIGQGIIETDTGRSYWWNGATWADPAEATLEANLGPWQTFTETMKNNSSEDAVTGAVQSYRWTQAGRLVVFQGRIRATSGFAHAGATIRNWIMPLPVPCSTYYEPAAPNGVDDIWGNVPKGRWVCSSSGQTAGFKEMAGDAILHYTAAGVHFVYHHAHPTEARGMDKFLVGNPGAADYSGGIVRVATTNIDFGFQIMYEAAP